MSDTNQTNEAQQPSELELVKLELAALISQHADLKVRFDRQEVELSDITALIVNFQNETRVHLSGSRVRKLEGIIGEFRAKAVNAIEGTNKFRQELLVHLQAWVLVLQMVDNAATHKEKNSRLRGCIELVNSTINKLGEHHFDQVIYFRDWPNPFLADGATRPLLDKIRDLESQLKAATAVASPAPKPADDVPY